ncbi:MAG: TonB-dependent receptor [Acidobacteria bacterium]|nr:TonB-dependent receptor [Acidobacteriota bacterium]
MRLRKVSVSLCLVLCLAGLLAPLVQAQEYRGRIQGIVTDASQAVVAGAAITLLNVNTGVRATRQTNETGLYLFDYVDPGSYTISVELAGFSRFVQENIQVQSRGDVTVNAVLRPGAVQESVTVTESPVAVQFNSTNVNLTIDTKLANELPRFDRNPFKLSLLNPAAVNTRTEVLPYHSWAANSVELGGGTTLKNDLQVDGSPIGLGHKATYTPNPDAVQEVIVSQNSVDAESGHSAGGVISMTLKSGTNAWHGSAFYLGRNPALNALTDRTTGTKSASRNNMWGGTLGNPVVKNKIFNFFTVEQWKPRDPLNYLRTLPTALERGGDFSQSRNIDGGIRTIYDPFSTVFDAAANKATRTPFPGNRIPQERFDPLSARLIKDIWDPNATPDNITGLNNFRAAPLRLTSYYNYSNRGDWNINEKWKVYGRVSRLHTMVDTMDPTPNKSQLYVPGDASARHAFAVSGDAVWTLNARTVMNFHGDYHSLVDDYATPKYDIGKDGLAKLWPSNPWYEPYMTGRAEYFPRILVGGTAFGRPGTFWNQHPNGEDFNVKVSQQRGAHYLKAGFDTRRNGGFTLVTGVTSFSFAAALTADTFLAPNTRVVGNEWATFLLGAMDSGSSAISKPIKKPRSSFYGTFIQDDYKLSRRITLNLGLRYEYESAWSDPEYRMSRYNDITQPVPEMQATPPRIPAEAASLMNQPYKFNGAWIFTDSSHPGMWDPPKAVFMPRVGAAIRLNDRSSLRVGWARFTIPTEYNFTTENPFPGFEAINFLEAPYPGYDVTQTASPLLEGKPQVRLSNPWPSNLNPLLPPKGKAYGRNLGLGGDNLIWMHQNFKRGVNDRFNISVSHQLPNQIVAEFTYFANFGHALPYIQYLNLADPQLTYTHKGAVDQQVANPFYNYLTPDKFPGPLRNQRTVSVGSLLKPYPQYAGLYDAFSPGKLERYHSFQTKVQRGFRGGYNFLFGYVYQYQKQYEWYDDIARFQRNFQYIDLPDPRHRVSAAGTYEFPFGKGRKFLSNAHPLVDAVLGGWQTVGAWYFNSGSLLRFGSMLASGDPTVSNPTPKRWFDTSLFQRLPAYTPRTNPWQYPGLRGPVYWEVQQSISKYFRLTEQVKAQFTLAAYNATNRLNRANPDTGVTSSTFGQTLRQGATTGRQVEFGLKFLF